MNFKKDEITKYALDRIQELKDYDVEAYNQLVRDGDLHNEIFNTDYYIIGTFEATEWLDNQVFQVIDYIKEYEEDNFGEVTTDLSNPEKLVNMYVYILGEEILYEVVKQ
jgi:succinate dehydrogenase flavin-adding protein (antitoxin of CptAB toxin-antitoxin module)